ncbi:5-carboxymethyl-2-hydroxymuconate Delta-isomerase [Thalassomonas actiniarum]|uniref:5-carboxymethyl-2-hydroxymuconate Delta-isomerase n=1 Tax=Thalassomonas actiniarum TaxID=485447 RepID=A0AAE9YXP2_9GAMM|nr:5-carboxymethyl-2-hydroxymuconate Delta-isomerase [Thalassomonas actiniarum]WDE01502.1 5-carboxymethyl-2-hydroxymuconate Delta-isomerase [Thalassomonas actiniarum]
MPHFVVDCSAELLTLRSEEEIMHRLHVSAVESGLFKESEIKVRINPYSSYSIGGKREAFVHVFASIMQGRSTEQKAVLSSAMVTQLVAMFPEVANIAMNVSEFEKNTYCNRDMLQC